MGGLHNNLLIYSFTDFLLRLFSRVPPDPTGFLWLPLRLGNNEALPDFCRFPESDLVALPGIFTNLYYLPKMKSSHIH